MKMFNTGSNSVSEIVMAVISIAKTLKNIEEKLDILIKNKIDERQLEFNWEKK